VPRFILKMMQIRAQFAPATGTFLHHHGPVSAAAPVCGLAA